MATQPATERGCQTQQRIVDAAADVVAEKGRAGVSWDEVGARASASRNQLYHYLDDKADLLKAVAEATNDAVLGSRRELFAELGSREGLAKWMDALVGLQEQTVGEEAVPSGTSSVSSANMTTTSALWACETVPEEGNPRSSGPAG